jgi:hypothetical protein
MKDDGAMEEPLFSVYIGEESRITFGSYDTEKYARSGEKLTWHNIISGTSFWLLPAQSVILYGDDVT